MKTLNEEIEAFKQKYTLPYSDNNNYIYLRLSAINNAIPKEERIKDTINKLEADIKALFEKYTNLKTEGYKLFIEVKSAYKNSTREEFIKLYSNHLFKDISSIKDILENKHPQHEKRLYIKSFDRLSRVFLYGLTFQLLRKLRNITINTLLDEEYNFELRNKNVLESGNLEQTMFVFSLMMFSSVASKHSEDMSNKIKNRVTKKGNITISSKTGNKWGAEKTISDLMRRRIRNRFKRYSVQEIREQSDIYQKPKGKKKKIAVNTILSILRNK